MQLLRDNLTVSKVLFRMKTILLLCVFSYGRLMQMLLVRKGQKKRVEMERNSDLHVCVDF